MPKTETGHPNMTRFGDQAILSARTFCLRDGEEIQLCRKTQGLYFGHLLELEI